MIGSRKEEIRIRKKKVKNITKTKRKISTASVDEILFSLYLGM